MKSFLTRYTSLLWALLKPLGYWGVFAAAFVDASSLALPLDPIVGGYVYTRPAHFWLICLAAAAGSALGSMIPYWLGRKGGELFLAKRVTPARMQELRGKFERREVLAIVLPAMMPPPMPFKVLVFAAGVFGMRWLKLLGLIFAGRLVRFLLVSLLVLKFGPKFWSLASQLLHQHLISVLLLVAACLLAVAVFRRLRREPITYAG